MPIVRKWVHAGHIRATSGPPLEIPVRKAKDARSPRGHHPLSRRRRVQPDAERLRDAQDGFESGMR